MLFFMLPFIFEKYSESSSETKALILSTSALVTTFEA